MKVVVHNLIENLTQAILPILAEHRDFNQALDAMCVVMAKLIHSSPTEHNIESKMPIVEDAYSMIRHVVRELIKITNEQEAQAKAKLEQGIAGFSKLREATGADGPSLVGGDEDTPLPPELQEAKEREAENVVEFGQVENKESLGDGV